MQRRRRIKCHRNMKRFTVVVVNGNPTDSYAGRSFEAAFENAMPDRGSHVDVYQTCATDAGAARLPSVYKADGQLVRSFRTKKRG